MTETATIVTPTATPILAPSLRPDELGEGVDEAAEATDGEDFSEVLAAAATSPEDMLDVVVAAASLGEVLGFAAV